MSATVVVKRPPVPPAPPKNINYATWDDAEKVANSLAATVVPSGTITVYEGNNQDVGGGTPTDAGLPLLIDFSINMPFKNELGVMVNVDVPFHEVAGEMVNRLDSYPNGNWIPSIVEGSVQGNVSGDMERR